MNYKFECAGKSDIDRLTNYKLKSILEYADNISSEEINRINDYVKKSIPEELDTYKIICINSKKIGCLLVNKNNDGVLIDEIYLEADYRNKGIGTEIINKIISENNIVYLWVYKLNERAFSLYKKLGFNIVKETETRYFMRYDKGV